MRSNAPDPSNAPQSTSPTDGAPVEVSADAECVELARAASDTFARKVTAVNVTNTDMMYPAFRSCYFAADPAGKSTFSVHLFQEQSSPAAVRAHLSEEYSDDGYGPTYRNVPVPGFPPDQAVYSYQSTPDGKLDWGGSGSIYTQNWRVKIGAGVFDPTVEQAIAFAADVARWVS